jgi:hypothetical protein
MNAIAFQIVAALISSGPAVPENPLLNDLVTKGVTMPDGHIVQLPPPFMTEGMTAAEQREVIKDVVKKDRALKGDVKPFLEKNSGAPISLRLVRIQSDPNTTGGTDSIRKIDICFVVYGDWDVLTGKGFSDSILKPAKAKTKGGGTDVLKSGYLNVGELAARHLTTRSTPDLKEYFLYTTFKLFDEVQIDATRFGVATKTPTGVVVAAAVDPRFAKDKQFPILWRPIERDAGGNPVLGPPQPYSGAGFYAKVTRLVEPTNAIFVEYHSAFYEPGDWFGAANVNKLPSELKKIIPYQVTQFRKKLAAATEEAAKQGATTAEKKSSEATATK